MTNTMEQNKNYKRKYREMDDKTKQKISASLTGRPKSDQHKQNISTGLKNMWKTIPHKLQNDDEGDDYISTGRIV